MNKVILFCLSLLTVAQSPIASAMVASRQLQADVKAVYVDKNHSEFNNLTSASITVDLGHKQITLFTTRRSHCPRGAMCILSIPAPTIITLPIVSRYVDTCGNTVYTASADQRPVDGIFSQLVVTDNSTNTCPTFNILPATDVHYTTKFYPRTTPGEVEAVSIFEGASLK